jgi:hypothetical protein
MCPTFGVHYNQGCTICGKKKKGVRKRIINLETKEVFPSIKDAAAAYKISQSAVGACANGRINTAAGYHWSFYSEQMNLEEIVN